MVRLHVVDDQVVELGKGDDLLDIARQLLSEWPLDRVDQGDLLSHDEVGVIADALGEGPDRLEQVGRPVVHPDPKDAFRELDCAHLSSFKQRAQRP